MVSCAPRSWRSQILDKFRDVYYGLLVRLFGSLPPGRAIVLLYHTVNDRPNPMSVPPAEFARQMDYLSREFEVVPLQALLARVRDGHCSRPLAAITFDDGFLDNFVTARPVLKALRLPATFYVTTGMVGIHSPRDWGESLPFMDWDEIRGLAQEGFQIGGHTVNHPDLTKIPEEVAFDEVFQGKKALEQEVGVSIQTFAYPFGLVNEDVRRCVERAGFSLAVTTTERSLSRPGDPLMVPRIGIGRHTRFPHFRAKLSRALDWPMLMTFLR